MSTAEVRRPPRGRRAEGSGGEPEQARMLAKEPEGRYPGPGVRRRGAAAGGARREPTRSGPGAEEGELRRTPGLSSPRCPEDARTAGSRWGRRHKVSRDEGRAGPRSPGPSSDPEPRRYQVSPSRCLPPGPTGPVPVRPGSRLTLRPPARLAASAGWPPRAPLLLPSARARGGPRARSLRPAALGGGGGAHGAGGGVSARKARRGGEAS